MKPLPFLTPGFLRILPGLIGIFLATGSARAGTVTIEFHFGTIDAPVNAVGILVADADGNGFHPLSDPSVLGGVLRAGEAFAGSDDVILAVLQAEDGAHWNGGVGFAETLEYIDFDALGISAETELIFHVFPELLHPGTAISEGTPFFSFRRNGAGGDGGSSGFEAKGDRRYLSLATLDAAAGGTTDFDNPVAGETVITGNSGDPHDGPGGTPTELTLTNGNASVSASLHADDVDLFSFTLPGPKETNIFTTGSNDTRGEVRDDEANLVHDPNADDDAGEQENFSTTVILPAGTYTVAVAANSGGGAYSLHVETSDPPNYQPDLVVQGRGDGTYDTYAGQTLSPTSKKARRVRGTVRLQNDGELADSFQMRAGKGTGTFRVVHFSGVDGNITAGLVAGTHDTPELASDAPGYEITTTISPNKRKIRKKQKIRRGGRTRTKIIYRKKRISLPFEATSNTFPSRRDVGLIKVRTK